MNFDITQVSLEGEREMQMRWESIDYVEKSVHSSFLEFLSKIDHLA